MISLELPADLLYRYIAVRAACAVGRGLGVSADVTDALGSAVGEAFNNAVLHATPKADETASLPAIEVEIEHDDRSVLVQVRDYGRGFRLDEVPAWDFDPLLIDELPEGGMGLYIIRTLMTEVRYEPGHPNILSMRRVLAPPMSDPSGPPPGIAAQGPGE